MNKWRNESWRKSPFIGIVLFFYSALFSVIQNKSLVTSIKIYTINSFKQLTFDKWTCSYFSIQPSILLGLLDNHKLKYLDLLLRWWCSSSYISVGTNLSSLNLEMPSQWLQWMLISFFMALSHALSKKFSLQFLSFLSPAGLSYFSLCVNQLCPTLCCPVACSLKH